MRSLSGTLAAAQKARVRRPHLHVTVADRFAGIRRLRWTQWYAGAEADNGHAAVVADDGSLTRARFESTTLYRSRVETPTSGDTYSSWTTWTPAVTPKANLIAFAKAGSTLWAFIVNNATQTQVYKATSADDGATWSAFALAFTNDRDVTALAAAGKTDGNVVVTVIPGPVGTGVKAWRWNGSAWTGYDGPSSALSYSGVAVTYGGDWNVVTTDEDTLAAIPVQELRQYIFGDGFSQAANTWSAGVILQTAISAAGLLFAAPYAGRPDVYRATFRQRFTGTVAYDRTHHTNQPATAAFVDALWREPVPLNIVAPFGAAISYDATQVFLTTARYVYQAPVADGITDITARVVTADLHETDTPKLSELILDNSDGAYTTPGSGAAAALTKGAEVRISPGYVTTAGDEYSANAAYYVEAIRHVYEGGRALVKISLGSPFTLMARHRFPRTVEFAAAAKNIFQQLQHIAARVGYELSASGSSSASANLYPPLALPPGTSALTAFRRTLDRVPDRLYARGEFLFLNEPLTSDTNDATYKRPFDPAFGQEIAAAEYGDALKDANHVQVFADADGAVVAEDVDYTETALLYSAPRQRADPYITAGADATARAAAEQRRQTVHTTRGDQITAPVHCGLEVNDVIALTDARHGLSGAKRRVLSLRTLYRRGPGGKARYDHVIELGAP